MEVVGSIVGVLFNKVSKNIINELNSFERFSHARQNLETTMVEARKLVKKMGTRILLQDGVDCLTKLCYDCEDVMEDVLLELEKLSSSSSEKAWCLPPTKNLAAPRCIKNLQYKLDCIYHELERCNELTSQPEPKKEMLNGTGHDDLNSGMPLIGRDEDIKAIIEKLLSCPMYSGVSIVGVSGLGKTALAKAIRKEREIEEHFLPLWVPLSHGSFNQKEVCDKVRGLLDDEQEKAKSQASSSNNAVLNKQHNKTLLIIFDNLSCPMLNIVSWMELDESIRFGKDGGSRIGDTKIKFLITTTRPQIPIVTCTDAYNLKPLSTEDCQAVIVNKALLDEPNLSQSRLSCIAPDLVNCCQGLPSVAEKLGFVLARRREDEWGNIDFKNIPGLAEDISRILRSNNPNMQDRNLLMYFSIFPSNYSFNIEDLVQLWVGEGFIQPPEATSSLEQTGRIYVRDLLGRSILEADDATHLGTLRDYTHKSIESIASKICQRLDKGESAKHCLNIDTRHLSFVCCNIDCQLWENVMRLRGLRTILSLFDTKNPLDKLPHRLFKKFRYLRVLALNKTHIEKLPDSIERLIHLRYLDISNTSMKTFSPQLPKILHKLQFLKLKDTPQLQYLPDTFHNFTNLIFLDWDASDITRLGLPSNIGRLSRLRSLPLFPVDDKDGHSIEQLQNMNCLHGSIRITHLENVKNKEAAEGAVLHGKSFLRRIELQWSLVPYNVSAKDVLEGLEPHKNLKELKIANYPPTMFPDWVSHSSRTLEKMHLQGCRCCNVLPSLGQLPHLKILVLEDMRALEHVNHYFYGPPTTHHGKGGRFPSLESLEFKGLDQLREWTGLEVNDMPRLHRLQIVNCPKLIHLPSLDHLSSLAHLQIERCQEIASLPELPDSLDSLIIRESGMLTTGCQDGGKDRPKLDRVPNIEIDYKIIKRRGLLTPHQQQ